MAALNDFEIQILLWVQNHLQCGFLTAIATFFSVIDEFGAVWIIFTIFLLAGKKTRPMGCAMAAALLINLLLCNVLVKPLVARVRPYDWCSDIHLKVYRPTETSFPSGHTCSSFAAAGAMVFMKQKGCWWAIAFSVLMGLSRIYLTVHYPTDVIGGALLGLLCGFLAVVIVKAVMKKLNRLPAPEE